MIFNYDIIVVGAGHAGCEASMAAANLGSKVLLITMDLEKIASMSCNPAMGGIAKGQILREIDALGGYSGIIADKTTLQFKMLNKSKGPAMWSPRAQCDKQKFSLLWRSTLEQNLNIDLFQGVVESLIIQDFAVKGVKTNFGISFYSKAVILTNGTFLNGLMHVGKINFVGGRISEPPSLHISDQLKNLGFEVGRMKTGTPVRIDARSIDFSKLDVQGGDSEIRKFSFLPDICSELKQLSCYTVHTTERTHEILKKGFNDSPLFDGTIQSTGPRYCPSIETKLITFSSKNSHLLFLEPESENGVEYYLNGFSSSLPWDIQYEALRTIEGFENVKIFRPGYAIEYDYFNPTQLLHTLETKLVNQLYFAGQINGTTGYEEAAAQGLISGINAHQKINCLDNFVLARDEAYIGVLIDDLISKGVDEPYRMFTSRAEYRILLRQDDCDRRLTPRAIKINLADKARSEMFYFKLNKVKFLLNFLRERSVSQEEINPFLESKSLAPVRQKVKLIDILLRPQISIFELVKIIPELNSLGINNNELLRDVLETCEIEIKYSGYIEREKLLASKMKRLENIFIKDKIDYATIFSLSTEARQKLSRINPETIADASRIPGVSPSDLNILLVLMGR